MIFSKPKIYISAIIALFALIAGGIYWFYNRDYHDPRVLGVSETLLPDISKNIPDIYTEAVVVNFGDKKLGLEPLGGEPVKVQHQDVRSIYEEAYRNTDVIQTDYPYKLKEELVFSGPGHPLIFQYNIKNFADFVIEKDPEGNVIFYDKQKYSQGKELAKVFTIPTPFVEDKVGQRSFLAVTTTIESGLLIIAIDESWFKNAKYPITLDPTVEINILNLYSHPQTGDDWEVEFTTQGQADLKIIPNDQATVDDDDFISLSCGTEKRQPQILAGDVIYYPNWQCDGTGQVVHHTLKADKHTLRFEFGDATKEEELITAWAYNDPGDSWWDDSWGYRIKLTVVNTEVDADLTNFPVYVNLDDLPDDTFWAHVKTACADVRITKTDGTTELPREIVSCDTGTKTGEMHFKADALADSTDTDFYIYYGNADATEPAADSTYGSQNVWTNSYQAVYHLQEDPSGNGTDVVKDSTTNAYHATPSGSPVNGTGKLAGNGVVFNGSNTQLRDTDQLWPNANDNITISMWNNEASADGGQNSSIVWYTNSGNERIGAHAPWANITYWDFGTCCADSRISGDYTPYDDKYSLLHYVSNGSTNKIIYIDGVSRYSNMSTADNPNVDLTGLSIGSGNNQMWHKGTVDEVRVATTTRIATWISTEYNNQSSPATFYGLDVEETAPAPDTSKSQIGAVGGGAKIITNTQLTPSNLSSGLVGYWTFNGDDTTWTSATAGTTNDISGNSNTGTMTNMSRSTSPVGGKIGQGFKFDGVDDYLQQGSASSLDNIQNQGGGGMSVAFWVKPSSGRANTYIKKGPWAAGAGTWMISQTEGTSPPRLSFIKEGVTDMNASYNSIIDVGGWQYIVMTWNGSMLASGVVAYKNGALISQGWHTDGATANSDAANNLTIGGLSGTDYIDATLDEVRIYNRVLTADEVSQLYKLTSRKVEFQP